MLATGKSKTAIQKSIAAGRLSATKDAIGRWQIDPSELERVYPNQKSIENDREHPVDAPEIERLKATVEGLERLCRQIEDERDSLRQQNIRLGEQNTRLTALLAPPPPAQQNRHRRPGNGDLAGDEAPATSASFSPPNGSCASC